MIKIQKQLNDIFVNNVNIDTHASVKMLGGKTPMILVEGKYDYIFYNQFFKPKVVRCCFEEEDKEIIPKNILP